MLFIPMRCELAGCGAGSDAALSRCGKCKLVLYCGAEHQRADWMRHKVECAHLKRLGLWGFTFDPAEELAKYPRGGKGSLQPDLVAGKPACGVCGSTSKRLERTECCGLWLCNDEDSYVPFSYSREFCSRAPALHSVRLAPLREPRG